MAGDDEDLAAAIDTIRNTPPNHFLVAAIIAFAVRWT